MTTLTIVKTEFKLMNVPVMRNGKPTKRTKKEWVKECKSENIEVNEKIIDNEVYYYPVKGGTLYDKEGKVVFGLYKFGRYGTTLHRSIAEVDSKGNLLKTTNGYDGPTGKGWGATFVKLEKKA